MSWITDPLDELTSMGSGLFLGIGNDILWIFAVIALIWYTIKHGLYGGLMAFLVDFTGNLLIAATLLHYYSAPIPGVGLSFHQLFPAVAQDWSNTIDMARLDIFFDKVGAVMIGLREPTMLDWAMFPVYWLVELLMWIIQALLFGATSMGFVALGIGNMLGPIFIPFLIWPAMSHLFWNWIQYTLQYSFYRVAAAAVSFVFSTALNMFLDNTVHGDYSLAHWAIVMPKLIVLTVALTWSILRVTAFVSDLFKGTATAGSNLLGSIASSARGFFL